MWLFGIFCVTLAGVARACRHPVPLNEYKERRTALRKAVTDGVIILFGGTERDHGDLRSPFFQEPNFYYLTGWSEPGAMLVLTPEEEMLFIPKRDPEQEKWTGPKLAAGDANAATVSGFDRIAPPRASNPICRDGWKAGGFTLSPDRPPMNYGS